MRSKCIFQEKRYLQKVKNLFRKSVNGDNNFGLQAADANSASSAAVVHLNQIQGVNAGEQPSSVVISTDEPDQPLPSWARAAATGAANADGPQPLTSDLPSLNSDLPHWAQEGLKKTIPVFSLDAPAPSESLPSWAKKDVAAEPLPFTQDQTQGDLEGRGIVGAKKDTMADCMALPEAYDGARVGLKQLPAMEIVGDDPTKSKDATKFHPSDSSISNLIYPGNESTSKKEMDAQSIEETVTIEIVTEVISSTLDIIEEKGATTPAKTTTKMPGRTPKSGVKIVQGQHVTMETEPDTEAKASIKMQDGIHATTESEGQESQKTGIRIGSEMHATKESEISEKEDKPHIKIIIGKGAMQESESETGEKQHIRTFKGQHSSLETTQDISRNLRTTRTLRANLESIPELLKLPRRSRFGHISQISRDDTNIWAPKLKRREGHFASLESDWRSYQVKPHQKRVKGQSVDTQSADERSVIPRLKSGGAMFASKESEFVDHDVVRLQKFRQQNLFGHSSDSSVQRLLYYGKGKGSGDDAADGSLTTEFNLVFDTCVEKLEDDFGFLSKCWNISQFSLR